MSSDDLANCAFTYVLIGAVIWALLVTGGLMERPFRHSRATAILISAGTIFGWPAVVAVFVGGLLQGMRQRGTR